MEFKVKGYFSLEDLKSFYKESGAKSIFRRLVRIFIITFVWLELIALIGFDIYLKENKNSFFIILMSLYLVFVYLRKFSFPKAVKKIYDSDKSYRLENEVVFTETQIETKDELRQEIIRKEDIYYIVFGDSGIYFYKSKMLATIVPKHLFDSEEQWNLFLDFAKENYIPGPKKFRIYKPLKLWMRLLAIFAAFVVFAIYLLILFSR